jgi:hydrogenase maturation protease
MARALIAGIGNVLFRDDGFGVAVVHELARRPPRGACLRDVGVRGLHLAYELLDPWDLVVVVDAVAMTGAPGTLHVVEPMAKPPLPPKGPGAHGMDLNSILQAARTLGASLSRVLVVGCDVADVSEGLGLSAPVEAAVPGAARLVESMLSEPLAPSGPLSGPVKRAVAP